MVARAGPNQKPLDIAQTLLERNVLNRRTWIIRDELRIAIVTWIDGPTIAVADKSATAV